MKVVGFCLIFSIGGWFHWYLVEPLDEETMTTGGYHIIKLKQTNKQDSLEISSAEDEL